MSKNYEDKIFFFEPPNKYCDLLWIKKEVFSLVCQHKYLIDKTKLQAAQGDKVSEMSEQSLVFEQHARRLMINLLASGESQIEHSSSYLQSIERQFN